MKHKKKQIIMHAARSKNCGQCALACPTRFIHIFNPLGVLRSLQMEDIEETLKNWDIFNCLCCNRCMLECPVSISAQSNNTETMNFANLIRDLRAYAHEKNIDLLKDKKIAQRFTHIYEKEEDLKENPIISYIKENKRLKISDNGEIGYFLGDFQDKNGLLYPEIAESVMKILNKVGIKPKLIHSAGAGHDNYWVGNDQLFKKIVQFNIKKIEEAEVKTIITYSAETFHTLKYIYPKYQKDFDKEYNIVHLSQFLSQNHLLSKFHIRPNIKSSIVIHDNSRMGRMGDQCYDPLREAFQKLKAFNIKELNYNRDEAFDIGTGLFIEEGKPLKQMENMRLEEIREIDAKYLLTTSKKTLHFLERNLTKPMVKDWALFLSRCIV